MTALCRMRLAAYYRSRIALAPLVATLVSYAVIYAGPPSPAGEAYAISALALFVLHAWQTKLILDTEPDTQRHLARSAVGVPRELAAGLLAAGLAGAAAIPVLVGLPPLIGYVTTPGGTPIALITGVVVHALAVPPAVAVGAWSSRAVTRSAGASVIVLTIGATVAVTLGINEGPLALLAPPLMATARAASAGTIAPLSGLGLAAHAVSWTALVLAGYALARRLLP